MRVAEVPAKERLPIAAPENSLPHSTTASIHTAQWGGESINVAGKIILQRN
ncbi:hypothetical protein Cfor_09200 [Coptotermes formosanus]|jgi:hypothetical protein|uniref:Uncharacterized protein n=1 Tax=Coptotermes formosanus TaxID=36987 RepID=A0A6L2PGE5_COPFO|nr:hypothetical protein Cfor_09200 [Coptotermes formosanus]